ncbi:phosphodiesterase [Thalassotalea aquiviva]|uniref:phosphodiesterase n=1 Tax=Thalassotalea aquiviva TaxID=3242415 RepID=UPI00352B035F
MFLVISDIHGCITYLQQALNKFEQGQYRNILLLGDVLNHGPRNPLVDVYDPKACIALLNQYADKIVAVRGNCDGEVDQMVLNFPLLSDMAVLMLSNHRVILSHGHLYNKDANDTFFARGDVYLSGHTHIPRAEYLEQKYLLNPGSITLPKGGYKHSYGVLTNEGFSVFDLADALICEIAFE